MKHAIFTLLTTLFVSFTLNEDWENLKEKNYTIKHPADWEVNQTGLMGSSFFLFSPQTSSSDQFRENVNLMIQDLGENKLSLKQYADISVKQIETIFTAAEIIVNQQGKANDKTFHELVYKAKQGVLNLRFKQRFWIEKNKAYILTFTTEQANTEKYEAVGNEIFKSFSFE